MNISDDHNLASRFCSLRRKSTEKRGFISAGLSTCMWVCGHVAAQSLDLLYQWYILG
jgi:hypothetical protein